MSGRKKRPISRGEEPNESFESYDDYARRPNDSESVTSSSSGSESGSSSYDSDSSSGSSSSGSFSSGSDSSDSSSSGSSTSSGSAASASASSSSGSSSSYSSEPSYNDGDVYDESEVVYEDDDVSSLQGEHSTFGGDSASRLSAPETNSGGSTPNTPHYSGESPRTNPESSSTYDSRVEELASPREEDEYDEESERLGNSNPFEDSSRDSGGGRPSQESGSTFQDSSTYYTRDSTEESRDYQDSLSSEQRYASPVVATSAAVPEPIVEESQNGHVSQDDNDSSSGSSSGSYSDGSSSSGSSYGSSYSGSSSSSYTSSSMDVPDSVTAMTSEGHGGSNSIDTTSSVSTSVSGSSSSFSESSSGSSSGSSSASYDDSNRQEPHVDATTASPVARNDYEHEEPQAIGETSRDLSPQNVESFEESGSESSYRSSVDSQREMPSVGESADFSASFVSGHSTTAANDEPEAIGEASGLESSYESEIDSQRNVAAVGTVSGESASFVDEQSMTASKDSLEAIGEGSVLESSYKSEADSQREMPSVGESTDLSTSFVSGQSETAAYDEPEAIGEASGLESSYGSEIDSQRNVAAVGGGASGESASFVDEQSMTASKDSLEAIGEGSVLESSYKSEADSQQNIATVGEETGESSSFVDEQSVTVSNDEPEAIGEASGSLGSESSESSYESDTSGSGSSESDKGSESGSSYMSSVDSQGEAPIVRQNVAPDINVNEQPVSNATKEPEPNYEESESPRFDSGESSEESGSVSTGSDVSEREMAVVGAAAAPVATNITHAEKEVPNVAEQPQVSGTNQDEYESESSSDSGLPAAAIGAAVVGAAAVGGTAAALASDSNEQPQVPSPPSEEVANSENDRTVSSAQVAAASAAGVAVATPLAVKDREEAFSPENEGDDDSSSSSGSSSSTGSSSNGSTSSSGSSSSGSSSSSSSSSFQTGSTSFYSQSASSSGSSSPGSSSSSSSSSGSSSSGSSYSTYSDDPSNFSPEPAMASDTSSVGPNLRRGIATTPAPIMDDASTPPPPPHHVTKGLESTMIEEGSAAGLMANKLEQSGSPHGDQSLSRALGVPLKRAQSPTTTISSLSASHATGVHKSIEQEVPPPLLQADEPRKKRRRKRDKRPRRPEGLANFEINVNDTLSALSNDESRLGVRDLVAMDGSKESVGTETLSMAPHTAHHLLHGFEALLAALLQVSDELELLSTFQDGSSSGISTEALNAILSHAPALDSVFVTLRPMLQHYLEEQAEPKMDAMLSRANILTRLICETTYRVCQRQEWSPRAETVFVTLIELLERLTVEITCLYDGIDLPDYKMPVKLRRAWSGTGHMEEIKTVYVTSDSWLFQQVCYEVIVSTDQWSPDTKDLAEACEVKQSKVDAKAGRSNLDARLASVPQLALQVLDKINGHPLPLTNSLASILRRILPAHAMTDAVILSAFSGLRGNVRKPSGFSGPSSRVAISSVPEVLNDPDAFGMRGVGKTTMAAMVASHPDTRRYFKDGIAWVNIGPKEMNYSRYTQCLRELISQLEFYDGVPLFAELLHTPGEPLSRRKRREIGFMIYARDTVTELLQNRNVLIVLDDVYFESDLEWFTFTPAIPVSMVRTGSSKRSPDGKATLLVTTRTRDLLPAADTVEMDLLEEQDAIRLLVNESGLSSDYAIAESKEALSVVRECANHPLAVKTVGRWLGLKHASAGVISSVEEIHEDVAKSIDRILKSGDIQGADMMYEIMSMSFSPAVNGEPTNVIKLCFAAFVTVFCNEEYYSDFLPSVYPPMIPVSTADVLFETLLQLEEDSLFQEGSLFYTQRREATILIPEALSKLGVLKVITTYTGDSGDDSSHSTSRYSLNDSRFLQIMHFIQYEYGEYLSKEEFGMRPLTDDAERRWNKAFATAYLRQAADWDSELPDASRDYAIEMIVSHLLRAEMYEEAANLLANESFVRGRIDTLGRENATRRHIMDCEMLYSALSSPEGESKSELNPRSAMKRAYEALGAQLNPKPSEFNIEEQRLMTIEAGRAHYEIGFSLAERRCWHAAIAHWESSQELLLSSLGMVEFVAAIQYNVGVVFAEMNEYEQGLASLKQCLRIRGAIHGEEHILYAQTIQKIGDVFLGMSDYAEAMDSYNWALDVMHVEPSHHRVDIGDILDNMGNIHYSMGEVSEALRCYEDALRSKKVELGDDHHELAATYQHIGNCLSDQGDTEEAIEHFQEAIRLRELDAENDAERDADILSIEGVLHNLTGRQEEGLHYYEKALEILASKAPHKKEKIAALLHLIGCVYLMNGEHKKAMKLFQESLQTRRKVLGFVHLDVASTLFNIAFLHQTRNRLEKALKCLEEALKIRQLRLPDSEKVALTHEKIGTLCKALGKSSKAEDSFEEALRIRRQIHGESHEAVATVLHEMGDLMDDLGEYDDAMRYYVDALDIRRKRLGPDHEDVAATLYSMGFTLHHQDLSERALQCFEESLNIRKRRLGEDSKEVGDTLNTMGYLQAKRGELDDALNLLWGALRIRKLHEDHVKVSETLKNIGNVHREKQEHELAVECYEECLRIRRTELGDDHEKVADALIAIGNVRSDMESTEDASRAYQEALKIRTSLYGEDDERVAVVLQYMGTMEFRSGDLDKSRLLLEDFIRIRRESRMPHDGDYVNVLFMIGNIHKMQGDDKEARVCWTEAYDVFQELGLAEENPQIAKVMNSLLYGQQHQNDDVVESSEEEEARRPGLLTSLSSRFKNTLRDEKMPKYGSKKSTSS